RHAHAPEAARWIHAHARSRRRLARMDRALVRLRGVDGASRARCGGEGRTRTVPRGLARRRSRRPAHGCAPADRARMDARGDRGLPAPVPLPARPRGSPRHGPLRAAAARTPGDRRGLIVPEPLRILGIAGSLRRASFNRGLLRAAVEQTPAGAVIETFDLAPIPMYNEDVRTQGYPPAVAEFRAKLAAA